MLKTLVKKFLGKFGYQLTLIQNSAKQTPTTSKLPNVVTDLEKLAENCSKIPGMTSLKSGQFLYSLCYNQELSGDVVEIGSWQGRSSAFLAQATKDARNGNFFAIDHFKGNVGKEGFYKVGMDDLSDLKENFLKNMKMIGLAENVTLLDMPNTEAIKELVDKKVRFLFIDGDHTKEGVKRDIELFFPLLQKDSIVVFDDYSDHFPGLVEAVNSLIAAEKVSRTMYYSNTLVIKIG